MNDTDSHSVRENVFRFAGILLGFAVLGGIAFIVYYLITSLLHLATLNATVATAFITGAVTVVASVSAVVVGRYFEKRKEVEEAFRERRLQAYERFVSKFAEITGTTGTGPDDLVPFLKQLNKEIILWAGPRLLQAYTTFLESAKDAAAGRAFFMLEDFYRAMREDLGHSNTGIKRGDILRLILKHEELSKLLAGMEKDPNYRVELSERGRI